MLYYAGADEAVNVDGGGSSTMYTESLGVLNKTSDGHERAVASGLFVVANVPDDKTVAEVRFVDWAMNFPKYGIYTPKFYGYKTCRALSSAATRLSARLSTTAPHSMAQAKVWVL